MSHFASHLNPTKYSWPPSWAHMLLIATALGLGIVLAQLPVLTSLIVLLVFILTSATLISPLVGVFTALSAGPFKPLTDYFVPQLPLDVGQIALIIAVGSWLIHKMRRHETRVPASPLTVPILIFLGTVSLSIPGSLSFSYAAKEMVKWLQMLLMMWMVIDLAGVEAWKKVIGAILAAGLIQALIGVWQFGLRGIGPEHFLILGDRFYRAYGSFEQPNPFAGFLGLLLPISIALLLGAFSLWRELFLSTLRTEKRPFPGSWWKALANKNLLSVLGFGLISGLFGAALIMSWSRGAWLGFGVASIVLVFASPRKASIGLGWVIVVVVGGFLVLQSGILPASITGRLTGFSESVQTFDVRGVDITTDNYAVLERLAHWQTAEAMARAHFWRGVGLGNYEPLYPAYALLNWPQALGHAHNIYLNFLAETGVIGLAGYIVLWATVIIFTWKASRGFDVWGRSVAVGLLGTWVHLSIHNFLDNLYVANLHLQIGALLGILTLILAMQRRQLDSRERNN